MRELLLQGPLEHVDPPPHQLLHTFQGQLDLPLVKGGREMLLLGCWIEKQVGEGGHEVKELRVQVVVQVRQHGGAVQKEAEDVQEERWMQGRARRGQQERGVQGG